ncbi:MAG: hypothetical protein RL220_1630, partial [Bacteroidota bacterium]
RVEDSQIRGYTPSDLGPSLGTNHAVLRDEDEQI